MQKRPEYMILIALLIAVVMSIIGSAVSCAMINGAVQNAVNYGTPGYNSIIEEIEGDHGNNPIDELLGNHGNDNGNEGDDAQNGSDNGSEDDGSGSSSDDIAPHGGYTEKDVPATMEIETPELTDDLQACINSELQIFTGNKNATVTAKDLTKDNVGKPELKSGRVLSQVSGKVTITNAEGKTDTIDYTSYYYAEDPTAEKITWYIYGYDLGSYNLFPEGFENASGNPMYIRDLIQGDSSALGSLLERDGTRESTDA